MPSASARAPGALALALFPLLVLPASATPAAAAAPSWSLAPAGTGRPSFYAEGTPGTALQDTLSVTNRAHEPLTVRLSGSGVPVAFARTRLTVPARTRADVPFTVTVPSGAAPGDRSGTLAARDAHGRTATVRLRLRVGGPALSALTVEHVAVHGDRITYELVNRGTTVLVPKLAVRADGLFGRVLDRSARTLPVHLAPGRTLSLSEPWPGRPALDAVDVTLTVTAAGGAHHTAGTSVTFVPWGTLGACGAGAAVATAAGWRWRRRRSTERTPARSESTGAVT